MAPLPAAPRVLIVRTGAIGDVVNALVFAAALRDARPNAHIGWVAHPLVVPLLDRNPCVDTVHVWPRRSGVRGALSVVQAIRAVRYDLALDLQRLQKSALLARLSGATRVIGFDKGRCKELSHLWTGEQLPKGDPRAHMVEQYLDFARYLELAPGAPRWPLPMVELTSARQMELIGSNGAQRALVLNLGASKPANRWPAEHFATLITMLAERDFPSPVVLTGGRDDAATAAALPRPKNLLLRDLVGATSLLELTHVLAAAALVVTGDTGPMHLAVAQSTPVLALFGPADPSRTGPFGAAEAPRVAVGAPPRSRPRILRVPPWDGIHRHTARMADITPELVFAGIEAHYKSAPPLVV